MELVPIFVSRIPLIILCSLLPFKKDRTNITARKSLFGFRGPGLHSFLVFIHLVTSLGPGFFICKGDNDLIEF